MYFEEMLGGMRTLDLATARRESWPDNQNIRWNAEIGLIEKTNGGPYAEYRPSQDDLAATDWQGDPTNPLPDFDLMDFSQLLRVSDSRQMVVQRTSEDSVVLSGRFDGTRRSIPFLVLGNTFKRI